jgi:hypothetical protein
MVSEGDSFVIYISARQLNPEYAGQRTDLWHHGE